MKVETYSYRYAEEILQHPRFEAAYNELIMVCRDCPVPIYQGNRTVSHNWKLYSR